MRGGGGVQKGVQIQKGVQKGVQFGGARFVPSRPVGREIMRSAPDISQPWLMQLKTEAE